MKKLLFLACTLFIVNATYSQIATQDESPENSRIEKLKKHLDLSDIQIQKLEELKSIKDSNNGKFQRRQFRSQLAEILNDDQKEKLKSLHQEKRGGHKKASHKRRKHFKFKKHTLEKNSELSSKLKEMRIDFDTNISDEDKALIVDIKSRKMEILKKWKSEKQSDVKNKEILKAHGKQFKTEMQPIREESKALLKKYKEDIKLVFEENKEELKRLKAKKTEDQEDARKHKHFRKKRDKKMKLLHFLFMDVDEAEEIQKNNLISTTLKSVSPNPTTGEANIFFEVYEEEKVRIEFSNINGQNSDVISDKIYKPGQHYHNIDISNYPNGTYIISINNGHSIQTEKLILQR